ncbi:Glutaminase [Corynebacterium occultum]|uniref:Glutaminase n=1 Tax=Corynebacterium occultum TaxID=2675219 RepID=A0A6B8WP39_9CORY|nr:glutaminase [Corynebacterium occultum]QGU08128.1 Glutaminase [Corynebacterium occultum]
MKTPIPDYLETLLDSVREDTSGEVADYIPELAAADPDPLGMALCTMSGRIYGAGDDRRMFSIQSVSKPFVYALALQQRGWDKVQETVSAEPSGEAFHELSLESGTNRPMNPMINAGAIAVNQLINGEDSSVDDRVEVIREFFCELAGRELQINRQLCYSELEDAERNLSIAHMLRNYKVIQDEAHDAVLSYTLQCATEINARDLAVMSATLAGGGIQPVTGKRILNPDVCRMALAVMASAGMYDAAGRWMTTVGIPAKSGVSGGLIGSLPGQLGIATFSPRLDAQGNSVRGVGIFQKLSADMGLHLMAADPYGDSALRNIHTEGDATVIRLQGKVNFSAAENILNEMETEDFGGRRIVLDIERVSSFNKVGRRMIKEALRRYREQGHDVAIYDPENILTDLVYSDGTEAETLDSLKEHSLEEKD